MTRAWSRRAAPVAMLVIAACTENPTSPPVAQEVEPPSGLDFLFPAFDPALLVVESTEWIDTPPNVPARVTYGDEEPPPTLPSSRAGIYDARTLAGIDATSAWAWGEHNYQGNKSRLETTVNVLLKGAIIGSQMAYKQSDMIFWFDFGIVKWLGVYVKTYVGQECGLTAYGSSKHDAWWEAVPGANIATFGKVGTTSISDQARQPECPPPPPPPTTAGANTGNGGYCWVSIWYDMDTGEILDIDVLYCEGLGG